MKHLNALNTINGLGCKKMHQLINFFGDSKGVWNASLSDLIQSGIGEKIAQKIATEKLL
ncbi:MAG: hypothetical protein ACD_9C00126G0004, partial [uncultured bacterium]